MSGALILIKGTGMALDNIRKDLKKRADKKKAGILQGFFKTCPGEYAEGDVFLGITVPVLRKFAEKYEDLALNDTLRLLKSDIHEERLLSLLILILKYRKSNVAGKEKIYNLYLKYTKYINNWDLVDATAQHIIGDYLYGRDKEPLYKLAKSALLWERRISILATFNFIKKRYFNDTLKIAEILLRDKHDLIHKAAGWMLREVGSRDMAAEEVFLGKYAGVMPRTMLRYAIEKFPEAKRKFYLAK